MEWYEKYGWSENPFELRSEPSLISGFNDIKKELLEFIKSGDCCLLVGENGMGKTILLKWIEELDSPGVTSIYINALGMNEEETKKINIDKMIKDKAHSWFGKKKMLVMLIDDVHSLPPYIGEAVKRNFDNKTINAVVLVSNTDNLENLKGNLLEEIGERKIKLRPLTSEEAMGMIINRIKHHNPFEPGSLEVIFQKSGLIPRNILEFCESIAKANDKDIITKDFVEKFFETKGKVETGPPDITKKLSPLQKDIVNILKTGNFTPSQIATKLNKPTKTITSQLAYLSLKTNVELMKRKGIEHPLVEKVSDKPAVYRLKDHLFSN